MISVQDLTVRYGYRPGHRLALEGVSLHVPAGECLLVTGPSGCGKSTLARALTGLIPHAIPAVMSGQVEIAGMNTRDHPLPVLAQQAAAVFQNPSSQLFHLTVREEVAFGPRNLGLTESEVQERVAWALAAGGIGDLAEACPAELSGGQKQRVAIASALAMQPRVLVLDEPAASLDVSSAARIVATLQHLREHLGVTIVLIEHRLAEVARLADRVLVLEDGHVAAEGTPDAVFSDRDLLRRVGLRRPVETAPTPWTNLLQSDDPAQAQEPLIRLENVSAGYRSRRRQAVLRDVSLCLYPGDFSALVGENGAGKSTLALTLAGLLKPQQGQVRFLGGRRPVPGRDVSLLFQNPAEQLFTDSVDEEVAFAPRNFNAFAPEFHEEILTETGLAGLRARQPDTLSMGQQQRTALAACLPLRPRLLILDEPTLGQDWGHLQKLMEFLLELNQEGTSILLITHDYKLVHRYARRVIYIKNGRIALDGRLRPQRD